MQPVIYKTNYKVVDTRTDISDAISLIKKHKASNPSISFFANTGAHSSNHFLDHEYDLYEYGRMIDTESLVARTFQKKKTIMFKQGFNITSKNKKNLEYVKRRLREIEYVTNTSFRSLLGEMAQNLICYHNTYVVKVRNEKSSTGKIRRYRGGAKVQPVAGWFSLAPETIQAKINEAGEGIRYRQYITGHKYRDFPAENMIHMHYNKRTGFMMGTPPLESVKDDILALRRIEESVETLIYKSLFPISTLR